MTLVESATSHHDDPSEATSSQGPEVRAEPRPGVPNQLTCSSVQVIPWKDQVVDTLGLDPRSTYVEQFWLPVIGPTCTLLLRRTAARLERHEAGFVMDVEETARALGLGTRQGRNSPFGRALVRCTTFELARWQGPGVLAVRRMMPPLARRLVLRLPVTLQEDHRRWTASSRHAAPSANLEEHRGRARRLALGLVALGEPFDRTEGRLLRWGVHPALVSDAVTWARRVRLPGESPVTTSDVGGGVPAHCPVGGTGGPAAVRALHP